MRHRESSVVCSVLVVAVLGAAGFSLRPVAAPLGDPSGLIVHEWGTFTSVAADDGSPVQWVPQIGPRELPCFVDRAPFDGKGWIPATVRMETPVLYFYSDQQRTVDVGVRFRRGVVTEWFPRADVTPKVIPFGVLTKPSLEGTIAWKNVSILPKAQEVYPVAAGEPRDNHYYAARRTDAAPIEVDGVREKFLFYRGVGNFSLPLTARLDSGGVAVRAAMGRTIGDVMLLESRGDVMSYRVGRALGAQATLDLPRSRQGKVAARRDLEAILVAHGLYPKEAAAMIDTWRESWFEDGLRLLYIVPRVAVDEVLPLDIQPAAANVARVFVGRIELITQATVDAVRLAIERRDKATLVKHGRFLRPIMARLTSAPGEWMQHLQFAYSAVTPNAGPTAACSY